MIKLEKNNATTLRYTRSFIVGRVVVFMKKHGREPQYSDPEIAHLLSYSSRYLKITKPYLIEEAKARMIKGDKPSLYEYTNDWKKNVERSMNEMKIKYLSLG